jgi:hypothetical protein
MVTDLNKISEMAKFVDFAFAKLYGSAYIPKLT